MSEREEFNVVEFYADGTHAYFERWLGGKEAVTLAKWITVHRPAAVKVIITDGGDHTVFQWERGQGVTFPVT